MSALTPEEIENLERFRHTFSMELDQAQDMINQGHILPLDHSLYASIQNIKNTLAEAQEDGAEITEEARMLLCADEAKRIFQKQLSSYARTLFEAI